MTTSGVVFLFFFFFNLVVGIGQISDLGTYHLTKSSMRRQSLYPIKLPIPTSGQIEVQNTSLFLHVSGLDATHTNLWPFSWLWCFLGETAQLQGGLVEITDGFLRFWDECRMHDVYWSLFTLILCRSISQLCIYTYIYMPLIWLLSYVCNIPVGYSFSLMVLVIRTSTCT